MKTTHTPGPWKWDEDRDQVASTHPDWKFSLICKIATGEDRKQEDANARLIAAAPELLEALETLLDCSPCQNGCDPSDMTCASNLARAAIAKAKGQS